MQYRNDINGLRAYAVFPVMLFHFNESWMPGGFAGVDVFFVISGFLMTSIIIKGLKAESFSTIQFYVARANRIIPALSVLCITLVIMGWFFLTPSDFTTLGKHIVGSISFVSNVMYWKEAGYFDTASNEKWLLHTWSLSVEWQFYLIYPVILVILKNLWSIKVIKKVIFLLAIIGFTYTVIVSNIWPNSSYYLLSTRAWEMLIGGIAFLYPFKLTVRNKMLCECIGFILLVYSYIALSSNTIWPGHMALIPVLGAFLIIQAQRHESYLTSNWIVTMLGKWSYSIYLWHWPIVVAMVYFSINQTFVFPAILLSIFLGFLSSTYIESIRFKRDFTKFFDYSKCLPIYFAFVTGGLGLFIFFTKGLPSHYPVAAKIAAAEEFNRNPRRDECHNNSGHVAECTYGAGEVGVIVIGDSHAQSLVRSVEKSMPNDRSVLDWTKPGCRTIEGVFRKSASGVIDRSCGEFISYAISNLYKYKNIPIIVSNRYSYLLFGRKLRMSDNETIDIVDFLETNKNMEVRGNIYSETMNAEFMRTMCKLSENNPVFLVGQTPEFDSHVPKTMAKKIIQRQSDVRVKIPKKEYVKRNIVFNEMSTVLKNKCDVSLIAVESQFCNEQYCFGDIDGRPAFFDDNHLSEFGSSKLIPTFKVMVIPKIPD